LALEKQVISYLLWQKERGLTYAARSGKTAAIAPLAGAAKVVFITDAAPWPEPAKNLFLKMTQAMKLAASDYLVVPVSEWETANLQVLSTAKALVILGKESKDRLAPAEILGRFFTSDKTGTTPVICTYDPVTLLQLPEMKRAAWQHLQQVMLKLSH